MQFWYLAECLSNCVKINSFRPQKGNFDTFSHKIKHDSNMKNAIFLPLTALLIAQSLSSCWKSSAPDRSHVGGRILEYGTDTPIEGAKVHLSGWSGSIGGGGSGGGHTAGSTTYSDRDGYYSFDDLNDSGVQLVNATKEGYFTDLDTEEIVLDDGNYDDVDVRIKPYAWLKVTIINQSGAYQITAPGYNLTDTGQSFFLNDRRPSPAGHKLHRM